MSTGIYPGFSIVKYERWYILVIHGFQWRHTQLMVVEYEVVLVNNSMVTYEI